MQGNHVNPSGDSGPKVYFIDYNYDHMPQQYSRAMASSPCGSVDPNPGGTDRLEDSKPVPPNVEINKARFSGSILSKKRAVWPWPCWIQAQDRPQDQPGQGQARPTNR